MVNVCCIIRGKNVDHELSMNNPTITQTKSIFPILDNGFPLAKASCQFQYRSGGAYKYQAYKIHQIVLIRNAQGPIT